MRIRRQAVATASGPFDLEHPAPRHVEQIQILAHLTEAVGRAPDLAQIYEAALDALQRSLGAERASILLFDPDGVMRFKAWRGLSDGYRGAVEGHSPWTRDAVDATPILVPDVLSDASLAPHRDTIRGEGIRALGFVPLVARGALIGKFMVYFDAPHVFDEDEVRLAQAIASHVAFAVDRRRAEDKLALYREIFANSNEAIAILDTSGVYLEQNAAHRALTGFEDKDLEGRTPAIHLGEPAFTRVAAQLAERGVFKEDVLSTSKGGQRREIELSAFAVRDDAGAPRCFVGIKRDVSERKRAERALRFLAEASAVLDRSLDVDATLEALAERVVPTLADWALVDVADGGRLRTAAFRHADPERAAALAALVERREREPFPFARDAFESGITQTLPGPAALVPARFGDDQDLPRILSELGLRSAVAVALKAHDRVLGVLTMVNAQRGGQADDVALAEDLASRAAVALDNARLYREAQESDRRKEEFLAVLAHELRNPLAPMLNSVELLRIGRDAATIERSQAIMERQVRNMKRLVDDLLDVSRITRGKIELRRQTIGLDTVVAHALETARPLLGARELGIASRVEPGLIVEADPLRLEQVLTNLLSNAAKYTPVGGEVRVTGRREGHDAVLAVRDSGQGIAPELLPRVFELFAQGSPPLQGQAGGLGIGLTIARGLVELHGGSIQVTSSGPDQGSEFTVRLPLAERTPGRAAKPAGIAALRVLVVDDNDDTATGMAELLRIKGHEVATASSGLAALEGAARFRPDLVLLDIGLPDMDGFQVAEMLRGASGQGPLRIVAISGFAQDVVKRDRPSPFDAHLVKPVDWAKIDRILAES